MKKYISFVIALLASVSATGMDAVRARPIYVLDRHEFALSGAFYPGRYAFGYDFDFMPMKYSLVEPINVSNVYLSASTYNKEKVTNSWTFSYTYNFSRIFALQAGITYEGGWNECYRTEDDVLVSSISSSFLTPMLTARFSWLNRKYVRMYSSVGAGMAVSLSTKHYMTSDNILHERPDAYLSLQVTPVGISVGKQLFGFVEVGVGTIYVGGCFGIGYRF